VVCGVPTAPQGTTACASSGGWEPVLGRPLADPGDRRDLAEAKRDLAAWLARWQTTYPKLCSWVEEHIEETLTFYRLPRQHHKHLKSTNLLERLNEAIKRRTHVVRIFPNVESCLRLIRALAVEMHENWLEAHRYLNMDDLREHKKEALRMAA
jgi:putative transposase